MKKISTLLSLAALLTVHGLAQMNHTMVGEDTIKVSDHVWAIMGFPNIAIVVGTRASLVVDTGLGPKNGATIARVVAKLAPNNTKLFLTTTHFHPEHAAGEPGFPPGTILIRDAVQQQEMVGMDKRWSIGLARFRRKIKSYSRASFCDRPT